MAEPNDPTGLPGGDAAAEEMTRALEKAAATPRDKPDDQEIAADDAGGSTVGERSGRP